MPWLVVTRERTVMICRFDWRVVFVRANEAIGSDVGFGNELATLILSFRMPNRIKLSSDQTRVVALIAGLVLIVFTGYSAYKSTAAQSWPRTSGTITESRTSRYMTSSSYSRRTRYKRRPKLRYKYHVGGKKYENGRITFTTLNLLNLQFGDVKTGFYKTLEQYPKGKSIVVYYNPENPQDAVVEPKLTMSFYGLLLIAGGLTAFGAIGLLPD